MKINEYNQMMAYLTRPKNVPVRKPNALPPKTKTIQKFKKGGKPKPREETMQERIDRVLFEFGDAGMKKPPHMDDKNIYTFEDKELAKAKKYLSSLQNLICRMDIVIGVLKNG